MTNEELLQQAKDQVAREAEYDDWEHLASTVLLQCFTKDETDAKDYDYYYDRAAELYAKEREKEAYIAGYNQNGGDPLSREIHLNNYLNP